MEYNETSVEPADRKYRGGDVPDGAYLQAFYKAGHEFARGVETVRVELGLEDDLKAVRAYLDRVGGDATEE